ncbi:probable RNA polymerase II nuclear localization protein SLC7A6OS isoform X1 [Drosophila nasuta]|uniref:probable RNA polymerase II nuclear localization protein SLC7A6OS isoform X1 n=1 Tax=Drosophila nasuta TaxID=42062 RepID=UPI00295EF046|nr:probable RNA polymerase II nuclear localization protein SLC7A6OS isoform X1 [Drosophila nasuta]
MPAVVRIKRRIDEEPHTAFVLNGKRRRLQNDENAPSETATTTGTSTNTDNKEELSQVLLKFAGTLDKQDDSATKQFAAARLNKEAAKELVARNQSSDSSIAAAQRRDRQRQEAQQTSREQRYRVVNCLRTTLQEETENDANAPCRPQAATGTTTTADHREITIVDIEESQQQRQQQQLQQPADSDVGYVYDLYVPENEMEASYVDMLDDNYLSLRPVDEIVWEDCYNDGDEDCDSDDSNQENYYTNEYPDDDEANLGSDDELRHKMDKLMFDDDDEDDECESSEDEDYNTFQDPYVHTIDTEADAFVDDVDFCNVDRQGSAYERFKRRILREAEGLDSNSDDDDDDEDYNPDEFADARDIFSDSE